MKYQVGQYIYIVRQAGILYIVWPKDVDFKLKGMLAKCKTKPRLGCLFQNRASTLEIKKCSMIRREDICGNRNGACCKTQTHVLVWIFNVAYGFNCRNGRAEKEYAHSCCLVQLARVMAHGLRKGDRQEEAKVAVTWYMQVGGCCVKRIKLAKLDITQR